MIVTRQVFSCAPSATACSQPSQNPWRRRSAVPCAPPCDCGLLTWQRVALDPWRTDYEIHGLGWHSELAETHALIEPIDRGRTHTVRAGLVAGHSGGA